MNLSLTCRRGLLVLVAVSCMFHTALAQRAQPGRAQRGKPQRLKASGKAGFTIEPLVQQLSGQTGDVLSFSFVAASRKRDTDVEIIPVTMSQHRSGRLQFRVDAKATELMEFITPTKLRLKANENRTFEGVLRIPRDQAQGKYIFGVLIRDLGQIDDSARNKTETGTRIRFVTQYLVRLEVDVSDVNDGKVRQLKLADTKIVSVDGRPQMQISLTNPTSTPLRITANCGIDSPHGHGRIEPFGLSLPINLNREGEGRYSILVMPQATVDLVQPIPTVIGSGRHYVRVELLDNGKAAANKRFEVDVDADDFPAQAFIVAELDNGIALEPAQLELSSARGGRRRLSVQIRNPSQSNATIRMAVLPGFMPLDDTATTLEFDPTAGSSDSVLLQPSQLVLGPGRSRKVSLTMRTSTPNHSVETLSLLIGAKIDNEPHEYIQKLPIVLVHEQTSLEGIVLSKPQFMPVADKPMVLVDVSNPTSAHTPLVSRVLLTELRNNRVTEIQGGFNQWLLPGRTLPMRFPLNKSLDPGEYRVRCELQVAGEVVSSEQVVDIPSGSEPQAALPNSTY
ncbi:MAG: hypothetical protein AAF664_02510 [Planctomycetota bacterium]